MKNRKEIIKEVLNDLRSLRLSSGVNKYAVEENIIFFEACKSIFTYLFWTLKRIPKIDGEKLLEINDLLPKWDLVMHEKLNEMEKKEFPGLITPLVKKIIQIILNENNQITVMSLGCGGMEAERQIINGLISNKNNTSVTFIGVDRSTVAAQIIKNNLKDLEEQINFCEIEILTSEKLVELEKSRIKKYLVVLCKNDIFELDKYFNKGEIDILFHTLFKHHFVERERKEIDAVAMKIGKRVIEYDGYQSWHNMIPQIIIGWNNPIFLNAEIFSHLRFPAKKELIKMNKNILFTKIGYYLFDRK